VTKSKFSKEDVNFIFNKINTTLELKSNVIMFYSPIYILEVISSISSIEYKKLFDMLETEIQELLLTELNKKYQFLDGKMHKKKIH
jgi:predicted restriction endonuclease